MAVWLGVLGWALQGVIEFGLYIPALAWPAFAFLGWLLGRAGEVAIGEDRVEGHVEKGRSFGSVERETWNAEVEISIDKRQPVR
jgi:hypothetical protein